MRERERGGARGEKTAGVREKDRGRVCEDRGR